MGDQFELVATCGWLIIYLNVRISSVLAQREWQHHTHNPAKCQSTAFDLCVTIPKTHVDDNSTQLKSSRHPGYMSSILQSFEYSQECVIWLFDNSQRHGFLHSCKCPQIVLARISLLCGFNKYMCISEYDEDI